MRAQHDRCTRRWNVSLRCLDFEILELERFCFCWVFCLAQCLRFVGSLETDSETLAMARCDLGRKLWEFVENLQRTTFFSTATG